MSRVSALLLATLLLMVSAVPVGARAPEGDAPAPAGDVIPGEVIVQFRNASGPEAVRGRGLEIVSALDGSAAPAAPAGVPTLVSTEGRGVTEVIAELAADPSVARVEPNYIVHLADEGSVNAVGVNDPGSGDQYSLDRMRVRDAWSITRGGANVIAVLDTGVQLNHPDLAGRIVAGHDFVNDDASAADDNGHGTWVSGIVAANANDGYGVAGISWTDRVMPIKVMNREGTGSTADLMAGIRWAADHGADVINMSVGGFPYSGLMQDAVNYAWGKGVVLVGAAGNNRRDETYYPASFDNVVSVSATQPQDEFSNWSSYGSRVDVSAPGASVLTTNCYACTYGDHDSWGTHTFISGTSFATPNVAGVVALIRARQPTSSPQSVVDRLVGTVDDLGYPGWDKRYGAGRVNAYRAVGGSPASVARVLGDASEGNNTLADATPVALGATVRPSIHPAGDVDLFAVDLPRAGKIEVRVTGIVDSRAYPWNKSGLPVDPVVEIMSTAGAVLTRVDRELEGGTELATWSVGGATRVLVRVSNWYPSGNPAAFTLTTAFLDEVPPRVLGLLPRPNSTMVPTGTSISFTLSEPVSGIDADSVTLRTTGGLHLPAAVSYHAASRRVTMVPAAVLPSGTKIVLELSGAIRDTAGLALTSSSYRFTTMPGVTFVPSRRITFATGVHVGHRLAADGAVLGLRTASLARTSGATSLQRAELPNLPGGWLYVHDGHWSGLWMQEGPRAWVPGTSDQQPLSPTTRIALAKGVHVGRLYNASGGTVRTRSLSLGRASGANVDALAVINGRRHYRVVNGVLAGMWVRESTSAYRPGFADWRSFAPLRRIQLGAGTHTGLVLDADGDRLRTISARLARTSGASVSAWAVVNGQARVRVTSGVWAGAWLLADEVLAYER